MFLALQRFLKKIAQILLLPLALIYGLITILRNKFFDWGMFKSTTFKTPTIVIGNLAVGGTGKTPHLEYLIGLLSKQYNICTLSRGYKRKSTGFLFATSNATANDLGDEPLQYYKKFNQIDVAVCEDRVYGINTILTDKPKTELILLDDAFQHRKLKAGLNILITDFNKLYVDDYLMPYGTLRELSSGSSRADIIIVSKTHNEFSKSDQRKTIEKLNPRQHQQVFFSYIKYGKITPASSVNYERLYVHEKETKVLLVTGIANPTPLFNYVDKYFKHIQHLKFTDHYQFKKTDIEKIKNVFNSTNGDNKIIITTEKDLMRLSLPEFDSIINELPLYYIPIEIGFRGNEQENFDKKILDYVSSNRRN